MKNKIMIIGILIISLMVSTVCVGYSAFNTSLSVSGDAVLRVDADVRITNLELTSKDNGGVETYNSAFSKDLTSMSVSLPNTNSSVKYRVTITNKNNKYFYLDSASPTGTYNGNVKYNIFGINEHDIYHDNTLTFDITFTTTSVNQSANITLKFDFQIINQTEWVFNHTGSEQTFNVPYNGTYKLEVWGASGGNATFNSNSLKGGYGGYSVGEVYLNRGEPISVVVGGAGQNVIEQVFSNDNGYNGGGYGALYTNNSAHGGGGGATHIAKISGLLSSLESYKGVYSSSNGTYDSSTILIVAGGGGGAGVHTTYANYSGTGGSGGGYVGVDGSSVTTTCYSYGLGGSQNAAGGEKICSSTGLLRGGNMVDVLPNNPGFGLGSNYDKAFSEKYYPFSGGGGGFFGGNSGYHSSGAGGSGYIGSSLLKNKAMYCYKCSENSGSSLLTISTTGSSSLKDTVNCSSGFSSNPISKCAKLGNGYVKITLILS